MEKFQIGKSFEWVSTRFSTTRANIFKEGLYRIQILCKPLSPSLFTPHQILYSLALIFSNVWHRLRSSTNKHSIMHPLVTLITLNEVEHWMLFFLEKLTPPTSTALRGAGNTWMAPYIESHLTFSQNVNIHSPSKVLLVHNWTVKILTWEMNALTILLIKETCERELLDARGWLALRKSSEI